MDEPNPLNEYGKSKYLGEKIVEETLDNYLTFRLSWLFGKGKENLIEKVLTWSKENKNLKISSNEISTPTYTKTVVDITLRALNSDLRGIYHLVSSGCISRYELAKFILNQKNIKKEVIPVDKEIFKLPAKRPEFSALDNRKLSRDLGIKIPHWKEEVSRYLTSK